SGVMNFSALAGNRWPASECRLGQLLGADMVVVLGKLRLEMQLDRADRAVPLLGDDNLGHTVGCLAAFPPAVIAIVELVVAFLRSAGRLGTGQVVFLTEDEHYDIGILLDRA